MTTRRDQVLRQVADLVGVPSRPVRVAVDGADGAGKTRFADELATVLQERGQVVERASVDDFHHARAHRHADGRTGETVWLRHFDYRALRRELLDPWSTGPGAHYRRRWHDVASDLLVDDEPLVVPDAGVLVFDGVFAQRRELALSWDLTIWLEAPDAVRVARLAARDGTSDDATHPDQARYLDAQRIYREACDPTGLADVVIDNSDPARPRLASLATWPAAPAGRCPTCGRPGPEKGLVPDQP